MEYSAVRAPGSEYRVDLTKRMPVSQPGGNDVCELLEVSGWNDASTLSDDADTACAGIAIALGDYRGSGTRESVRRAYSGVKGAFLQDVMAKARSAAVAPSESVRNYARWDVWEASSAAVAPSYEKASTSKASKGERKRLKAERRDAAMGESAVDASMAMTRDLLDGAQWRYVEDSRLMWKAERKAVEKASKARRKAAKASADKAYRKVCRALDAYAVALNGRMDAERI